MLRTSANVNEDLLARLENLSEEVDIEISKLIPKMLLFAAKKIEAKNGCRSLVQYQERMGVKRTIVNYYLSEDENELLSEIRQKYKVSISLLLYVAFLLFWEQFVESLFKGAKIIVKKITDIATKHNSYAVSKNFIVNNLAKCVKKLGFTLKET